MEFCFITQTYGGEAITSLFAKILQALSTMKRGIFLHLYSDADHDLMN